MEVEQKPSEALEMEQKSAELERKIVRFTNIDTEKFTHSFRGVSISVQPGESYIARLPEGDHLATHLARKLLARSKKKTVKQDRGVQLWNDKEVSDIKKEILSPVGEEAGAEQLTPAQRRQRDQEHLKSTYGEEPVEETKDEQQPVDPASQVTKEQLIADLKSRNIEVNDEMSYEDLTEKLLEAEAAGITPDNPKE